MRIFQLIAIKHRNKALEIKLIKTLDDTKIKWEKEIKIGVNLLKIMGIDQSTFINAVHLSDVQQK